MSYGSMYKSDVAQDAQTPKAMMRLLNDLYFHKHTVFDPCPANPKWDGLAIPWKKLNYVNCEFRKLSLWVDKALAEAALGRTTVMLMPARLNTKYWHRLLTSATSIGIWLSQISFIPFEDHFPLSICTVQVGGALTPMTSTAVAARRIRADAWTLTAPLTVSKITAAVRTRLAPISKCSVGTMPQVGRCFVMLTTGFADSILRIVEHCKANDRAVVVVQTISTFHGLYMQQAFPLIRQIIFLSQNLTFDGLKCFASNQILVISKRPVSFSFTETRVAPVWLLNAHRRHIHD